MKPRAITGFGIVSTLGIGRDAFYREMRAPHLVSSTPAHPIETFDGSKYPEAGVAEVRDFDPTKFLGDKGLRTLDRLTKLLIVSARLAMHDAGFKKDNAYVQKGPEQVGICCSNAYGSLEAITELDRVAQLEDARYINPAKFPNTVANSASGYVSIWEDLRALNVSVSDGNCGALDAVACADIYLETGRAEALLVGGAEAMSEALYLAFHRLGALHKGPESMPLTWTSHGTRLGEGAILFAMEPEELAAERNAPVLAVTSGYGTAFLPPDSEATLIHASLEAVARAIRFALDDAGVTPREIDVVAASVSGLLAFDCAELQAIDGIFGPRICVAAPKAVLGETLGAGGGMGMAAAMAWLDGAPPGPIVRGEAPKSVSTVLVIAMGFYGNASAVVMRRTSRAPSH